LIVIKPQTFLIFSKVINLYFDGALILACWRPYFWIWWDARKRSTRWSLEDCLLRVTFFPKAFPQGCKRLLFSYA